MHEQASLTEIFQYVQAKKFFTELAPGIKSWYPKLKGRTSRGDAIEFSPSDHVKIQAGVATLMAKLHACT